jgi:hypothetical protein
MDDENQIYEVLASFFTDVIYNKLYPVADRLKNEGKYKTRSESYIFVVTQYCRTIQNKKECNDLIDKIHKYFIKYELIGNNIVIGHFLTSITNIFIQKQFRKTFDLNQRIKLLKLVINESFTDFSEKILSPGILNNIIDKDHDQINTKNVRQFQNMYINILKEKKDHINHQFSSKLLIKKSDNGNNDNVYKKCVKDLIRDNTKLSVDNKKLTEKKNNLKVKLRELKEKNQVLEKTVHKLKNGNNNIGNDKSTKDDGDYIIGNNTVNSAIEKLNEINLSKSENKNDKNDKNNDKDEDDDDEEDENEDEDDNNEEEEDSSSTSSEIDPDEEDMLSIPKNKQRNKIIIDD